MFAPIYRVGAIHADTLVVAGDSRVQSGISLPILHTEELGRAALLTGPSAQLRDIVLAARALPARRLVLAVSPIDVHCPAAVEFRRQIRRLRAPWSKAKIDDALDTWFSDQHRRFFNAVPVSGWRTAWYPTPNVAQTRPYIERNLAPETRAERQRKLRRFESDLRKLVADGWQVVCVRIPCDPGVLAIEDEAFDRDLFGEVCDRAGVAFIDYAHRGIELPTGDGSHLTVEGGKSFTRLLARDLAALPALRRAR